MNKFSIEDQYKIVSLCRNWVYKSKNNKNYAKNTIQKDKSIIKDQLNKKELDWSNIKDVLYYIHINLDPEKQQSIGCLKATIKMLEGKVEHSKILMETWEINERDRIKRDYEKTFEDKYCVGQVAELKEQLEIQRAKKWDLLNRTKENELKAEVEELKEEKVLLEQGLAPKWLEEMNKPKTQKICENCEKWKEKYEKQIQTIENYMEICKKLKEENEKQIQTNKILNKQYKKAKTEKRNLMTEKHKLEDKLDDYNISNNIEMSISDVDTDSTDSS
jgi:hypothetical protein